MCFASNAIYIWVSKLFSLRPTCQARLASTAQHIVNNGGSKKIFPWNFPQIPPPNFIHPKAFRNDMLIAKGRFQNFLLFFFEVWIMYIVYPVWTAVDTTIPRDSREKTANSLELFAFYTNTQMYPLSACIIKKHQQGGEVDQKYLHNNTETENKEVYQSIANIFLYCIRIRIYCQNHIWTTAQPQDNPKTS